MSFIKTKLLKKWNKLLRLISGIYNGSIFFVQSRMDLSFYETEACPVSLKTGGFLIKGDKVNRKICQGETHDNVRRDMLVLLLRNITTNKVEGDLVEIGVYQGLTARIIHQYTPERKLHLFDTFTGFDKKDIAIEKVQVNKVCYNSNETSFSDTNIDKAKKIINPNNNVLFYQGYFPHTVTEELKNKVFSFVHIDVDLYEPTKAGLEFFLSQN